MTPPVMSMTNTVAGMVSFGLTVPIPDSSPVAYLTGSYSAKTWDTALTAGGAVTPSLVAADPIGEQGGWATLAFKGKAPQLPFKMWHILNFAPVAGTASYAFVSDQVRAWADAYYKALAVKPFFTDDTAPSISYSPTVTHEYAQFKWQGKLYHAVLFRHVLRLNI